jgi:hypothetical protein
MIYGSLTYLGRYCETLGWLAITGIKSSTYHGNKYAPGHPSPTRKAVNGTKAPTRYARRYLDFNRKTFSYHAVGSQTKHFDTPKGLHITSEITSIRTKLNLTALYGCAPATYCMTCVPYDTPGSIFSLVDVALGATVINTARATTPRLIIGNTGSIRFDLYKGPFTYDDSFIVSPFTDGFQYIPDVPYATASKVLATLNGAPINERGIPENDDFSFGLPSAAVDSCIDPTLGNIGSMASSELKPRGVIRRTTTLTPGYTTNDDFGVDGDDTIHTNIPFYAVPNYLQANGSFPTGSTPDKVDLIFLDFIAADIIAALGTNGGVYTEADVSYYLPADGPEKFTTQQYLPAYAKLKWQAGAPDCPT